jgi:hypothetical protein
MKITVPDWKLERFLLRELPAAELEAIERAQSSDPELARRLEALVASNREILAAHPPRRVAAQVSARSKEARPGISRAWAPVLATASAVALGALVATSIVPVQEERLKGEPLALELLRKTDHGEERLLDGAEAHPKDRIQIRYRSSGRAFGAILSIDGRGAVTLHWPPSEGEPAKLTGETALPRSYELDDAPRFERFFLVAAVKPFELSTVLDAARRLASEPERAQREKLDLPDRIEVRSMVLRKVSP